MNAGFSTGKPWLPVAQPHVGRAVSVQAGDEASMLAHYRRVLAFRRGHPALVTGTQGVVAAQGDVVTLTRTGGGETLYVAFNLGDAPAVVELPKGETLGVDLGLAADGQLAPWQGVIVRVQ